MKLKKILTLVFSVAGLFCLAGITAGLTYTEAAYAAGPTMCQPGWSALVHKVYSTNPNMANSCANAACWPVTWEMSKTTEGYSPLDCWYMGICAPQAFMYRTMYAASPSAWTSLPKCHWIITDGPWHSP